MRDTGVPVPHLHERFAGQVIIVTGAAGGIGSAIARRAAAEGAHVVAADRREGLTETVKDLLGPSAPEWLGVPGNLAGEEAGQRLADAAIERFGRIDVLVNNAGGGIIRPFMTHDEASMRETVDRNLWTTVYATRAVMPTLIAQRRGRIVNVGADSVRNGLFEHAMYNAAKGGVHGLTTGLARELAPYSVTVNTVAPTAIETPFVLSRPPEAADRLTKNLALIPMGRFGTVDEVASAGLYLASEEAGFITGQVISVNGGSTML
jgi:2,3-dihydroxy-2,3-dihydro-p-cumate dehydrogenase